MIPQEGRLGWNHAINSHMVCIEAQYYGQGEQSSFFLAVEIKSQLKSEKCLEYDNDDICKDDNSNGFHTWHINTMYKEQE